MFRRLPDDLRELAAICRRVLPGADRPVPCADAPAAHAVAATDSAGGALSADVQGGTRRSRPSDPRRCARPWWTRLSASRRCSHRRYPKAGRLRVANVFGMAARPAGSRRCRTIAAAPLAIACAQRGTAKRRRSGASRAAGITPLHCCRASPAAARPRFISQRPPRIIRAGRQALLLVPEINLTPQLEQRIAAALPRRLDGACCIAASPTRSGVANGPWPRAASCNSCSARAWPCSRRCRSLGLIVVDEEHDASFKQQDGVRYHARDVAIYRARLRAVPVILGSATPSLESYAQAIRGRYRWLRLPRTRYRAQRRCRRCTSSLTARRTTSRASARLCDGR